MSTSLSTEPTKNYCKTWGYGELEAPKLLASDGMYRAHNPKVAGSNPAPAIERKPRSGGVFCLRANLSLRALPVTGQALGQGRAITCVTTRVGIDPDERHYAPAIHSMNEAASGGNFQTGNVRLEARDDDGRRAPGRRRRSDLRL
jgi:hypothetical protein